MSDHDPAPGPARRPPGRLTRRDAVTAGLGVVGLAALGVTGGFVSKRMFPQSVVYEYPEAVAAQGVELVPTPACAEDGDEPTKEFDEGPYYVPASPLRSNLRLPGHTGRNLALRGRVVDTRCRPIPGAVLDFWQVDEHGLYDNVTYNYRGHQFTRRDGSYELLTLLPVPYTFVGLWRAPHIHVKVQGRTTPLLTTQVYFDHDPQANAKAFDYDPALTGQVRTLPDGSAEVVYTFVLKAA
jgi:protocatechuate 3,4-dioxygenase beta subunit